MRLSEAIALGRTLIHPMPGFVLDYAGLNGCALGMGYKASGGTEKVHPLECTIGLEEVIRVWPWLENTIKQLPCKCESSLYNYAQVIGHLFDDHIMDGTIDSGPLPGDRWTLDQLIDWVRSVEPEEAPSPTQGASRDAIHAEVCAKEK
jgi:hypothetical protein